MAQVFAKGNEEDIEIKVSNFYDKIQSPVLSGLNLVFSNNVKVYQTYPKDLPDLFKGSNLIVFGRFKGTGNMEIHLSRHISERRVFPAININRSGTRREELMMKPDVLQKTWILRKILHPMDELAASEFLIDRLKLTKTNNDFFDSMKK